MGRYKLTYYCPKHTVSANIDYVETLGVAGSNHETLILIDLDSVHELAGSSELFRLGRTLASPAPLNT